MHKKLIIFVSFYLHVEGMETAIDVDHFNVGFLGKHGDAHIGMPSASGSESPRFKP